MSCLCKTCGIWVDCGVKNHKSYGFCLIEDLFTYTCKEKCSNYEKGLHVSEKEWEEENEPTKWFQDVKKLQ